MNFKQLRESSGMNITKFAAYFDIPYRTVQSWEREGYADGRPCPRYLLQLIEYKLRNEKIIK